jgi:glyoxylase-like metal-dependent hydrolase (beta-lactamase superfamily II)
MKFFTLQANNAGVYTGRTGNNTYLLPGAEPALIDAGIGDPAHVAALDEHLRHAPLARVIVTHAHSDHASGAEAIAARWPAAEFVKMPWPDRDGRYAVTWRPLRDSETVRAGDVLLEAIHTPGHAPDHVCLWHESSRSLFCGDLASRGTSVVIPGGRGGSVREYLQSLERVIALQPAVLLPSHGPAIYDVERTLRHAIDHRLAREQQIVDLLAAAPRSIDALLAAMYPAIHPQLQAAARDSVLAHLVKLEEEGRVEKSDRDEFQFLRTGASDTPRQSGKN